MLCAAIRSCSIFKKSLSAALGSSFCSTASTAFLELHEVEEVLNDVRADDVKVIPVGSLCHWTDYMVFATGRSPWHVRNIAEALIYRTKQKQKGSDHLFLPSVEGQKSGKWVVIDSGSIVVHALDENARSYYNMENLWACNKFPEDGLYEDLEKAFVRVRRINNSKKRS